MRVGVQVTGKNSDYDVIMGNNIPNPRHIPITIWEEIDNALALFSLHAPADIRSQGGKTYLVSTISHISMSLGGQL